MTFIRLLLILALAAIPIAASAQIYPSPGNTFFGPSSGSAPANTIGSEASWYLDVSTGKIYGPKTTGTFPASGYSLTTWLAALSGAQTVAGTWTFTSGITSANPLSVSADLPTISSCGTNPPAASAGSSNNAGRFTLGTGTPTACTVTFATAFATQAYCTVTPASSGGAAISGGFYISAQSKSAFTLTIGTGTDSLVFNYTCVGN